MPTVPRAAVRAEEKRRITRAAKGPDTMAPRGNSATVTP